ncbi:outer membrane protein assembly factor BamB family protein [Novosphingobium lentum]|uniref:outer membrane protein assembly factor BamB family protein n=1 Tax=Novosphingobium lentum TaxID=145287 RepID=UPI00083659F4|nr:PQQ-binding-like beta-propeller repeat protein [Novosphingobium lentum]
MTKFMRKSLGAPVVIAAMAIGAAWAGPLASQDKPSAASLYEASCAGCHGADMSGAMGPSLKSATFAARWREAGYDALLQKIRKTMPPTAPGSLTPDVSQAIAAHIAAANGIPTDGSTTAASAPVLHSEADAPKPDGNLDQVVNHDDTWKAVMQARAGRLAGLSPVTEAMLRNPPDGDWLQWRRTDDGYGFSPLTKINAGNVGKLTLAWSAALTNGSNGITPLVHDGVLFVNSNGNVQAFDVRNGDLLWEYDRPVTIPMFGAPATQPRAIAIYGQNLYVPTIDNHMLAIDMHSGKLVWDHYIEKPRATLRINGGPIVVRGKVIQGITGCAGAEEPGHCFIVGLDAATGAEAWRFYTIPKPGEPGSDTWNGAPVEERNGASVWAAGTYDAVNNNVLFGTGQTYHIAPLMAPGTGKNDALYTDSTLALNPDTGKLNWHYQHMQRDVWDMDWVFERQIIDLPGKTGHQRAVMTMGKLGIIDMLDARTGKYIGSYDSGLQTLVTKIDPTTGRKTTDPALEPKANVLLKLCPYATGARSWPPTSFDPRSGTLFMPYFNDCMNYMWMKGEAFDIRYGVDVPRNNPGKIGGMMAIDVAGKTQRWNTRQRAPTSSAALATAGNVVFGGGRDRSFKAYDSTTGAVLWEARLDQMPSATPITFAIDGEQYVAVTTGGGNSVDILVSTLAPELESANGGIRLWVFKLGGK